MATEDHSLPADRPLPQLPEWADPEVAEDRLDAQGVSRRGLIGRAGLFGAGFLGASALGMTGAGVAAAAESDDAVQASSRPGQDGPPSKYVYLVGDHHVHTVYSHDAKYGFAQSAAQGRQFGLDWIVYTEHANFGHANAGGAEREHAEILKARQENPRVLIFQGLEWYVPAAEHATIMVAPGRNEVELLRQFELTFDAKLNKFDVGAVGDPKTPANEAKAVEAIRWLGQRRREGFVEDVLVLANHPSRLGIVSPHELRAWHDADPSIFLGFEGAPGSQANADPAWVKYREGQSGPGTFQRGEYQNAPSPQSWPRYPIESYRTFGGFDWMTATVGGMWDALLSEGRLWSVTSNSDNHRTMFDTYADGDYPPGRGFDDLGSKPLPKDTGVPQPGSDFWPGQFSRTHVGVERFGYRDVMNGLRAGRVWVDHGQLLDGLDVWMVADNGRSEPVTLGGRLPLSANRGATLYIRVTTASRPNYHGVVPTLAHVDVITGTVTGKSRDADAWQAPDARVTKRIDVAGRTGTYTLKVQLPRRNKPYYVRLRGSDGNRHGVGPFGARVDPAGPIQHPNNDGDPWRDIWFYSNPIFVDVKSSHWGD
ncbi:histidinol-phosphatase [Embleya scabrispora]|uniref:Histidinol-phosphatase n=1 Tax=Embleya scabrispora TaxID=159449 RepID=A0A1T3NR81_9ACTN|nr:PHP domain-containing protein [Embleya scabrispora]OPC79131.1 histidinol-phosphatase [Embleya scabrispora]